MKKIKLLISTTLLAVILTSCACTKKDADVTDSPSPTPAVTEDAKNKVEDAADAVGEGVKDGVENVGDTVKDVTDAVTR